jgi:hypothetical protein
MVGLPIERGRTTPKGHGQPKSPQTGWSRVVEATPRPNKGGPATPKGQTIFYFLFFIKNLAIRASPQLGWFGHPQRGGQLPFFFFNIK